MNYAGHVSQLGLYRIQSEQKDNAVYSANAEFRYKIE